MVVRSAIFYVRRYKARKATRNLAAKTKQQKEAASKYLVQDSTIQKTGQVDAVTNPMQCLKVAQGGQIEVVLQKFVGQLPKKDLIAVGKIKEPDEEDKFEVMKNSRNLVVDGISESVSVSSDHLSISESVSVSSDHLKIHEN